MSVSQRANDTGTWRARYRHHREQDIGLHGLSQQQSNSRVATKSQNFPIEMPRHLCYTDGIKRGFPKRTLMGWLAFASFGRPLFFCCFFSAHIRPKGWYRYMGTHDGGPLSGGGGVSHDRDSFSIHRGPKNKSQCMAHAAAQKNNE